MTALRRLRLLLEMGDCRMDFRRPAARILLALFGAAAVAALGTTVWLAFLDTRSEAVTVTDPRVAYVNIVRDKIQVATEVAFSDELRQNQESSLELRIELNPDGKLVSAAVTRSSGIAALDDLALRAVRDSAPFEPFPLEMRRTTNILEINSAFFFK